MGPAEPLLVEAIGRAAMARPEQPAVRDSRASLSYAELWEASGRVAAALRSRGVVPGDRVAVTGVKRGEAVTGMLGAMRCGAAFVPLDPGAPVERVAALLADAEPWVVIDERSFQELRAAPMADDLPTTTAEDIAYCMYTSGSSGRPKGVQIHHGAMAAFMAAMDEVMQVEAGSRCLNTSPFFFDVSVVDVWYPLAKGATVYLTDSFLVPDRVLDLLEKEQVTHFSAVGSILSLLRRARTPIAERHVQSVRRIMTGAEVVDPATVAEWVAAVPNVTVFNGYGPTEATCCCFAHPITAANVGDAPYPIGRPFPGTHALVVGDDERPCPPGTVGELLIAGAQVTPGYLNRPDENQAKFVERDGHRWYRTGDLVVEDEDGTFHFRGRRDHELKVRGYRIHPSEIITALHRCDGVAEAHVTAATDERGERILVAAVAPLDDATLDADALRDRLRSALPEYMIPRRILVLPGLPKLPSGKIDDRELAQQLAGSVGSGR